MFSIGEFSRITGLTIKTLRFYHERGVLVPARVEVGSGYRYYDQRNLETARAISALREFEFSLDEIVDILNDHSDESDILIFLERRKKILKGRIARDRDLVLSIDRIIQLETETRQMTQQKTIEVEVKALPPILVAGVRMTGRYEECGKVFGKLSRSLGRQICGPPLCLMYDDEYREEDANFEPCMPVRKRVQIEDIDVRELPEQQCLSIIHLGPYKELGRTYEKLIRYAKEQGYTLTLPSREVYLKGPGMIFKGNPKKYLTEIQIPFENASDVT
ncbi:MAG: MerR family transcriptional regulator [Planctomycetota bacterium]|nr:MAG: MerR family transcriptional regulator [Planctomycetota bacterium]